MPYTLEEAQRELDRMNRGEIIWDDNKRAELNRTIDALRPRSPEEAAQAAIDAQMGVLDKTFGEAFRKMERFEEENPFNFDEELARASAAERFDPYYDAELKDFMTGVTRERERSQQDEERLRRELTASTESYLGRTRRQLDQALESSREGFAGAGLFFSGKRLRREGEIGVEAEAGTRDYLRQQGIREEESQLRQVRGLEDVGLRTGTFQRRLGAEKETAFLTDIAQQKREESLGYEEQRRQVAGPFYQGGSYSLSNLL